MTRDTRHVSGWRGNRWRIAAWFAAGLLLLLPLLAMRLTDQVIWNGFDFAVMGALMLAVGGTYELAVRMSDDYAYRAAAGLGIGSVFLLIWIIGAVGIIGDSSDAPDLMYGGVIATGIIGALLARFRASGMAWTMFAMTLALTLVAIIALVSGMVPAYNSAGEILAVNTLFAQLFVGAALLFRLAAREALEVDAVRKLKAHMILSILITVFGLELLTFMVIVESEPGALPLLLIVLGGGWYIITRYRMRALQR